jgi:hypothetical protein
LNASFKSSADVSSVRYEIIVLDQREDRILTARLDLKVIPILGLLYLICFLGRTNIANVRIAGMESGLHMPPHGYNTALWTFYLPLGARTLLLGIPYLLSSSLHRTNAISGRFATCQGLTESYKGLLAIRLLMGIVETGLPAGAGLLTASYYRKKE